MILSNHKQIWHNRVTTKQDTSHIEKYVDYCNRPHTTCSPVEKYVSDGHDELNDEKHLGKEENIVALQ